MNISPFFPTHEEYVRAAPDFELSSSHSNLLHTLLNEEDQYDYNQILTTPLPNHILPVLHQLCAFLHLSSSIRWMATVLIKRLLFQQHACDFFTIVASLTLTAKYLDSSSQIIDYSLLAQYCHIDNIQHIHNAELDLLNFFSYDICVTTPDHFFSYFSNLDDYSRQIVQQTRCFLSIHLFAHQTYQLLHSYPSSIVALSLIFNITSNTFILPYITTFLKHKKHPSHYLKQLRDCITQLHSVIPR